MSANGAPATPARPLSVFIRGVGLLGPGLPDWSRQRRCCALRPTGFRRAPCCRRRPPATARAAARRRDRQAVAGGRRPGVRAGRRRSARRWPRCSRRPAATPPTATRCARRWPGRSACVSPTRFTNSVHNAAAGYWHIATASRAPSTSLCGYDASFGAGLARSGDAMRVLARGRCCWWPATCRTRSRCTRLRRLPDAFGVALVLAAPTGARRWRGSRCASRRQSRRQLAATPVWSACAGVPAARALPLLQALARDQPARLAIGDAGDTGNPGDVGNSADRGDGGSFVLSVQLTPTPVE